MSTRKLAVKETPTQDEMLQAFPPFVHARGEFAPETLMNDPPYAEFMPGCGVSDFDDGDVVAVYERVSVYRVKKITTVSQEPIKLGGGK